MPDSSLKEAAQETTCSVGRTYAWNSWTTRFVAASTSTTGHSMISWGIPPPPPGPFESQVHSKSSTP